MTGSFYMNFDQEIIRLCEEAVACKSEAGAAELARQAQTMMHARIEELRGNLAAPPSPRESCLGLVVGAFLIDTAKKLPPPTRQLQMNHDDVDNLRKLLSEAHDRWAQTQRPRWQRWLGPLSSVFKSSVFKRRPPRPDAASPD